MNTSRTFTEPSFLDEPKRTYTGFDQSICAKWPKSSADLVGYIGASYRIAIATSVPQCGPVDLFALDYDAKDGSVYENACKEFARYCNDEGLLIIGFYTENSPFTGNVRKGKNDS